MTTPPSPPRFFARFHWLLLTALLLCALASFGPHPVQAASRHRRALPGAYPPGLVAVPSTRLQIERGSRRAELPRHARFSVTVRARGYADPALYHYARGQWARVPSFRTRRRRGTVTLDAGRIAVGPGARYAVLGRRTHRRSHFRHSHWRRNHPFRRLTPRVEMSPPIHVGP